MQVLLYIVCILYVIYLLVVVGCTSDANIAKSVTAPEPLTWYDDIGV